jgi:soluble lytic murein transglycosylase-like protein
VVFRMRRRILITGTALAALASLGAQAHAGESVTLRNGFEMQCHHHAEVEGRVRLYLTAGQDNYIEIAPNEIAQVDQVPDLPEPSSSAPAPLVAPASGQSGSHSANAKAATEANLSPADLHQMLLKAGGEHNLDVDLLASLVKAESGGNAHAVSRTGARGLMQLMPGTAAALGVEDSFKPEQNVRGGTAYLDELLTRYHDQLALALAAYNAGPLAVDKYHGIPPYRETQAYVARVIHEFNRRVLAREAQARQNVASASDSQSGAGR